MLYGGRAFRPLWGRNQRLLNGEAQNAELTIALSAPLTTLTPLTTLIPLRLDNPPEFPQQKQLTPNKMGIVFDTHLVRGGGSKSELTAKENRSW